ncbi:MAG: hypothetical protein M1834_002409 [Cirrosporium novae-zelandiae]|nr:MAG: hypothetical protein M1834_002409 [Cirrosporium novae-zelandiae]
MGDVLKNLFGGGSANPSAQVPLDDDFADFAGAPDPSPASISPVASAVTSSLASSPTPGANTLPPVLYTKWYRVWERAKPSDFLVELIAIPLILIVLLLYLYGSRTNRSKARAWISSHYPLLSSQFALVGFGSRPQVSPTNDSEPEPDAIPKPDQLLKQNSTSEFIGYATGRLNVAFLDIKLSFYNRANPFAVIGQFALGGLFDSISPPTERMVATIYPFSGKEKDLVPVLGGGKLGQEALEARAAKAGGIPNSSYEGFVWAVVNKDCMRFLRDERYDVSLTATKDHSKLPAWATIMSESAEITDRLLTPELASAVTEAGPETFEYLLVSDQPADKPTKLNELSNPPRSIHLSMILSSPSAPPSPVFKAFLQIPDMLAPLSRSLRPEVHRKLQNARATEKHKLERLDAEEREEERRVEAEKKKRDEREKKLRTMNADEQRRFLEKEKERDQKRREKRMTRRG